MSALAIVIDRLLADSTVSGIVGTTVRPVALNQATDKPPAIIVNVVSGSDDALLAGAGQYFHHRIQTDCIALSGGAAATLGDAVIGALNGIVKTEVAGCKDVDVLSSSVDFTDCDDTQVTFRRVLQFDVWWRKA